jgi:hypothetical protein
MMTQQQHEGLINILAVVLKPRNYHQKKVLAQIFVRRWAISHGIDLSHPTDVIWCKE